MERNGCIPQINWTKRVRCVGRGHMRFKEKVKGNGRGIFQIFSSGTNQAKYSFEHNYPELFQIYISETQ